jgi:protein phosphatase 2C family protein 2/3
MGSKLDQSGACAIVCLLLDETVYLANVGDSHAVMAKKDCDIPEDMNIDHKPSDKIEYKRIVANGGKLIRENNKRGTQSAIFVSLN